MINFVGTLWTSLKTTAKLCCHHWCSTLHHNVVILYKISDEEIDEMIRIVDKNGDGKISYSEFRVMMGAIPLVMSWLCLVLWMLIYGVVLEETKHIFYNLKYTFSFFCLIKTTLSLHCLWLFFVFLSMSWRDYIWRHKLDWRQLPWHFFWIYFSISSLQLLCVMISHWLTVLKHKMQRQILFFKAGFVW